MKGTHAGRGDIEMCTCYIDGMRSAFGRVVLSQSFLASG